MTTPTPASSPLTRREVWLTIALFVARDGLPAPVMFRFTQSSTVGLAFDRFADVLTWVNHLGISHDAGHWMDHPAHAERSVSYGYVELDALPGWLINVAASEPLEVTERTELASKVAAAILQPDSPRAGAA